MSTNYFTQTLSSFGGLDRRVGSAPDFKLCPEMSNFKIDSLGRLKIREGLKRLSTLPEGEVPHLIWSGSNEGVNQILVSGNRKLYLLNRESNELRELGELEAPMSTFVPFNGTVYGLNGKTMYRIGSDGSLTELDGYVPLVAVGCNYNGGGTKYENPNLLTDLRRVQFSTTPECSNYKLPEFEIAEITKVVYNGEETTEFTTNYELGIANLGFTPKSGINNLEVTYRSGTVSEERERVMGCTRGVIFANRLFFYGNPKDPTRLYHSSLADGIPGVDYVTETDYHVFDSEITDLVPYFNRLMIFFKDSTSYTYAELATDQLGVTYTSFPVYTVSGTKGNRLTGKACSIDGTPVTFCPDGLNKWVSTAILDERNAECFSEPVFDFMGAYLKNGEKDPRPVFNRSLERELWICAENEVMVYNYRNGVFYSYGIEGIRSAAELDTELLLGKDDGGIYLFSEENADDDGKPIEAVITSPFLSFGTPFVAKNLDSLDVYTQNPEETEISFTLTRGNGSESHSPETVLTAEDVREKGKTSRRLKSRLCLKRFMTCAFTLRSSSPRLCISGLSLSGKLLVGKFGRLT